MRRALGRRLGPPSRLVFRRRRIRRDLLHDLFKSRFVLVAFEFAGEVVKLVGLTWFRRISHFQHLVTDRHYIIYADESDKKGRFYSNFFGGVLLEARDRQRISDELNQMKRDLGLLHEVKWQYVDQTCVDRYIEFVKGYFAYVAASRLKVRIMFTQNMRVPTTLQKRHYEEQYFLLYYQFIKHAFGLKYADHNPYQAVFVSVLPDKIPDTKERIDRFKDYLCRIPGSRFMRGANLYIPKSSIADVDSKEHVILQGLDLILGAMCSRLNEKLRDKPAGKNRRGKRTVAKEKLYKVINQEIRKIYPNFNVGVGTGCHYGPSDRWTHPYRHWLFMSGGHVMDRSLGKKGRPQDDLHNGPTQALGFGRPRAT